MNIISERIRQIREDEGLSQENFASKLRLTKQTVSNYETGVRQPGLDIIMNIADKFSVSLEFILGRSNSKNNIMPEISESISQVWKDCEENEQLSDIFNNMLEIMKRLKHSYELFQTYELTETDKLNNVCISESVELFSHLNKFFEHSIRDIWKEDRIPISYFHTGDQLLCDINTRLTKIKILNFDPSVIESEG